MNGINTTKLHMNTHPTIGCAIVTYRAKNHLEHCLKPLLESPLKPKILVVDSSSNDGTVEIAQRLGAETVVIPKSEFNHGTTRELARKRLGTDIVCLLTQDAYMVDKYSLERLVAPIVDKRASIAYARQIPHKGAHFFEAFARNYNYPEHSHVRSIDDTDKYGVFTFFCSNSCAAYSNAALDEIGGFNHVLLGEDTVATAKLLRKGHKIAYAADALVHHSHRYSLWQEFNRNFDTGLARKGYAHLLDCSEGDSKRGLDYMKSMLKRLAKEQPHLIPYALAHGFFKWSGYQIGKRSTNAPIAFKKALSSQKFFWESL
jgi:Predicted glycosyltransferases